MAACARARADVRVSRVVPNAAGLTSPLASMTRSMRGMRCFQEDEGVIKTGMT